MDPLIIFALQFATNLIVYAVIARWYLMSWLARLPLRDALIPVLLLHTFRTFGMVFLVPTVVDPNLAKGFAVPAAYGDLLAALLAAASIIALHARLSGALALVWVFNVEGTLDLLNALYQGATLGIISYQLGVAWFIPTFLVPGALVTHAVIFTLLLQRSSQPHTRVTGRFARQQP